MVSDLGGAPAGEKNLLAFWVVGVDAVKLEATPWKSAAHATHFNASPYISPPLLQTTPTWGGNLPSCVALGTNFGVTFRLARPPPRTAPASLP